MKIQCVKMEAGQQRSKMASEEGCEEGRCRKKAVKEEAFHVTVAGKREEKKEKRVRQFVYYGNKIRRVTKGWRL